MKPLFNKNKMTIMSTAAFIALATTTASAAPLFRLNPLLSLRSCPNPSVVALNVSSATPDPRSNRINITVQAVVKNTGNITWNSHRGQQSFFVSELGQNRRGMDFTHLAPGQSVAVTMRYDWWPDAEFQSTFVAAINYDADITIDNNPANDDCSSRDNRRVLTPSQTQAQIDYRLHSVIHTNVTIPTRILPIPRFGG